MEQHGAPKGVGRLYRRHHILYRLVSVLPTYHYSAPTAIVISADVMVVGMVVVALAYYGIHAAGHYHTLMLVNTKCR